MYDIQDFSHFKRNGKNGGKEIDLAVDGISCASCMKIIEHGLASEGGIFSARVNLSDRRVTIEWDETKTNVSNILNRLEKMGYKAYPFIVTAAEDAEKKEENRLLICMAVAGFASMNVMLLSVSVWAGNVSDITVETRDFFHWVSGLIAIPAALYAGRPFFESAWRALRLRGVNMDVPISLGVLLALIVSAIETLNHAEHAYFDSAIMLLFFLLVGRVLERRTRRKTRTVATNLAALKADKATKILGDGSLSIVPVNAIKPDDIVLVCVGERISVDGEIIEGETEIDASLVTGETRPANVSKGDEVYAGTLNLSGTIKIKVKAAENGTLLAEVQSLLEKANIHRNAYVELADRVARYYAPFVHITAALTFVGWIIYGLGFHDSILIAITVLIITCPCALGLAVPAVQVVATGACFSNGILLHSGDALERLAEVDVVAFDKTGTLTKPEASILNKDEISTEIISIAGRLALTSNHPLAKALACAANENIPISGAREESGKGVFAQIHNKEIFLGKASEIELEDEAAIVMKKYPAASLIAFKFGDEKALFAIGQALRVDAASTINVLKKIGYSIEILSGDRDEAVKEAAQTLGVSNYYAALKPQDKIARLEFLRAMGKKVLMVGDGLNDAPALAAANVSISPIEATHLAQAQADAVFMGEKLDPVLQALQLGKKAKRIMIENLFLAIIYNFIAIPIAIAGLVTPLIAALAMSGSSIIVTLNALRAGKIK